MEHTVVLYLILFSNLLIKFKHNINGYKTVLILCTTLKLNLLLNIYICKCLKKHLNTLNFFYEIDIAIKF